MCGVIGIIGTPNSVYSSALSETFNGLLALQHRGQDAAGLYFVHNDGQTGEVNKRLGRVSSLLGGQSIQGVRSSMCLGHTRYSTIGDNHLRNVQPMCETQPFEMSMVHNGNLVNYHALVRDWEQTHSTIQSSNDAEILLKIWAEHLKNSMRDATFTFASAIQATQEVMQVTDGGYAVLVLMPSEGLLAFRDPHGIRPLVLGQKQDGEGIRYCLASETTALSVLGFQYLRDVEPGELIWIDVHGKIHSAQCCQVVQSRSTCMFEWVYFAAQDSVLDGRTVYSTRLELGRRLGRSIQDQLTMLEWQPDVVCPIPDTSRPAALGVSEIVQIPYREVFLKNVDVQRSFILNSPQERAQAVRSKISPIVSEIAGRDILLVDDSLVRGTTSQNVVSLLRQHGARRVGLVVACPPIQYPCLYGIDFPNPTELIAANKTQDEIAAQLNLDFLFYLDVSDLYETLGNGICRGCLTGSYPTKMAGQQEFVERRVLKSL